MVDHPADNEIEISIFGPGFGEAILIHVGSGAWIAIDSCIDPKDGKCVPLDYLEELNVDLKSGIKRIIATHWHNDHIRGLSNLVEASPNAIFCCATAFTRREFLELVQVHQKSPASPLGRASTEIAKIMSIHRERKKTPWYVGPDRTIYSSDTPFHVELHSLSPSDEKIDAFLNRIIAELPVEGTTQKRVSDLNPNDVSIALSLILPNGSVLFGADIEETPAKGWTTILNNSQCIQAGSTAFKIPHHGSRNGHCDEVWETLLIDEVVAVLTPWQLAGRSLPAPEDVTRILALTPNAYSTATPGSTAPIKRESSVTKHIAALGIELRLSQPRPGRVTLRRFDYETNWNVVLDGTAKHLSKFKLS